MKCFYAEATEAHDPVFRLTHGAILRNAERAERAHRLIEGLTRLGFDTEEPPEAPREALLAVHSERFLDFLETAWALWQELPGAGCRGGAQPQPAARRLDLSFERRRARGVAHGRHLLPDRAAELEGGAAGGRRRARRGRRGARG